MKYYKNIESQLSLKVSDDFIVQEYQCKCHKCPLTLIDENLILRVQLLRSLLGFPLHITSGYRCWVHNKAEGGVQYSDHIKGQAVDLKLPVGGEPLIKMLDLVSLIFPYWYNGGTFVHCSIVPR